MRPPPSRLLVAPVLLGSLLACAGEVTSAVDADTGLLGVIEWEAGRRHGISEVYYPDGVTPKERTRYEHGVRHGPHLEWHPNGQAARELSFRQGLRHGPEIGWHRNGRKASEGEWIDGDRHGPWVHYADDGAIASEETWEHGTRTGLRELETVPRGQGEAGDPADS